MTYVKKELNQRQMTILIRVARDYCWHCRKQLNLGDLTWHNEQKGRGKAKWFCDSCYKRVWQ